MKHRYSSSKILQNMNMGYIKYGRHMKDTQSLTMTQAGAEDWLKLKRLGETLRETHRDCERHTETGGDCERLTETLRDSETGGDCERLTETGRESQRL